MTFHQLTGIILGHTVKWYKNDNNITEDAAGSGGYEFNLAKGKNKIFRVKITSATDLGLCLTAESNINGTPPPVSDAVVTLNNGVCL